MVAESRAAEGDGAHVRVSCLGPSSKGEEHVVEAGGVDGDPLGAARVALQAVEKGHQRVWGAVDRNPKGEVVIVVCPVAEGGGGTIEGLGVREIQTDVAAGDAPFQLVRRALGDQPAVVEHSDAVGKLVGLVEVLSGEKDGSPRASQLADDLPHGPAASGVEPGGRLIEEDQPGVTHEGHGQVQPATHASRVGARHLPGGVGQVETAEQRVDPAARRPTLHVLQVGHQHEVLGAGEQVVHRGELTGDPDERSHLVGLAGQVKPADTDLAAVRGQQSREDSHGTRLSGTVGTE